MPYVRRANVVLNVEDDSLGYYIDLGYDVLDENGNVVTKAIPNDLGVLRKFYIEATEKIKRLEARIEELENQSIPVTIESAPKKRGRPAKNKEG